MGTEKYLAIYLCVGFVIGVFALLWYWWEGNDFSLGAMIVVPLAFSFIWPFLIIASLDWINIKGRKQ